MTSACAARWNTTSAVPRSRPSRMSRSTNVAAVFTFSRLPVERSSTATTSSPSATSRSTRFEPMNPAAPVTTARMRPYRRRLMFVTFEGIDGSGKTTQAALLAEWAARAGHEVVAVREPGGTALGERIRELLLDGPEMTAWAEAALFAAARAELAERVIRPALLRGAWVVCDRYVDSSLAYQGAARGLDVDAVRELNDTATGGLVPDLTCVLLVDPELGRSRLAGRPARLGRVDGEFVRRGDAGYRDLAASSSARYVALDGSLPPDELARRVQRSVQRLIPA